MNFWQQTRLHLLFIFFGIAGFLARVGLVRLTAHQGLFGGGIVWANCAGCFIMGYLVKHVFVATAPKSDFLPHGAGPSESKLPCNSQQQERSPTMVASSEDSEAQPRQSGSPPPSKSDIPLYVGLTTGFCGTLTSLCSAVLELFEIAASTTSTISGGAQDAAAGGDFEFPNSGYGIPAGLAYLIITATVSTASFRAGGHLATVPYIKTLTLTPRVIFFIEMVICALGTAAWIVVLVLAIVSGATTTSTVTTNETGLTVVVTSSSRLSPAARYWTLAMVFSPIAVYMRYWLSRLLNPVLFARKFPLGTFSCNVLATLVLAVLAVLQFGAPTSVLMAGGISCQVVRALADGFCATLSTVSTLVAELHSIRRK